ncbi:MAG: alpha-amylase family glycosyl hydrolase [Rikenellaceae bacterium]
MQKTLPFIESDEWLQPAAEEILYRHSLYLDAMEAIDTNANKNKKIGDKAIIDYANAHRFFGWQRDDDMQGWWFREWLPAAYDVYIFGEFNSWQRTQHRLDRSPNGVWSIFFPDALYADRLLHGSLYKIHVHGDNGWLDRIPVYATRVVQDDVTKNYTAQFWVNTPFDWGAEGVRAERFKISPKKKLLIYEAHIGMATEQERVGTYIEFKDNILPLIKKKGYNAIQLMAVAEHPYYGSFGYHVSSLFAPSSRFGTPEELKELVRRAHKLGIAVIMDIVHAHYVKNTNEGIAQLDGTSLYSPEGEAGYQPYWDSMNFNFARPEVRHMLLSNAKYWLEEFHFDGYRFDGVTSMLYHHHGYTKFDSRDKFFNDEVNRPAITYLTMANKLIHAMRPDAVTIAEDVSGMPGICIPVEDGGVGFDYRLAMSIPDFWIKLIKDQRDEEWSIWEIWDIMTSRLPAVKSIAYAESHDQAMVGDKTIAFRLMDAEMYTAMNNESQSIVIDRGIALHKMIRLATITMGGDGYLNFMGNEFGHPEWIDFPREGNGWSYTYARRQWSLENNGFLRYRDLGKFDTALMKLVSKYNTLGAGYPYRTQMDTDNRTMVYTIGEELLVILNWHGEASIPEYECEVRFDGNYIPILSSDEKRFGGFGRVDMKGEHFSFERNGRKFIKIYNTSRTATIYKIEK